MPFRTFISILFLVTSSFKDVDSFQVPITRHPTRQPTRTKTTQQQASASSAAAYRHHNTVTSRWYRDDPEDIVHGRRTSVSFADRMRNLVTTRTKKESPSLKHRNDTLRPSNVKVVSNLKEFKSAVIDQNEHRIVVIRYYATWCKACQAVSPSFYKFAKEYDDEITFVEVPLTDDNSALLAGLEIPSLPYGQIYLDGTLVDSKRMLRKHFSMFKRLVTTYINGESLLPEAGNCTNPYTIFEEDEVIDTRNAGIVIPVLQA